MANRTPEATSVAKRDIDAIHEIERLMLPEDENQTREMDDSGIDIVSSDSSDESSSSETEYCAVTFAYTEADGTEKIAGEVLTFEKGTPYSVIRAYIPAMPSRNEGYWYFTGWTEDFSGDRELTADIVSRAQYEPAQVSIEIDWNGASNANITEDGSWSSPFKWMGFFPDITPIPEKQGSQFNGVFLFDGLRVLNRTHNADGKAISIADNPAMGSRTEVVPTSPTVWQIPSCMLKVVWGEPIQWNTQEDLRNGVGAIPCPFADDPSSKVAIPSKDAGDDISFEIGFPESFVKPIVNPQTGEVNKDARVISRKIVNSLGNIGTQAQFYAQCGGYYTFDQAICDAIGGYPQSAFLRFYDADTNCLRTVYSLVDNNTWNFLENGVDGIHWKYVDDKPTLSLEIKYDDFIDLRDTLFVNTGIPDFYEVPYDSYLQMHALSYCDMSSTLRDEEQYMRARTALEYNSDTKKWDIQVQEVLQGAFAAKFSGVTFVDIYNEKTNTTNSIPLRSDGSIKVSATIGDTSNGKNVYYQYKLPRYVVTQGALFLNKGDKIRIRGVYSDKVEGENIGDVSRVHSLVLTDMEVQRAYLMKFANLYRIGWRV